MARSVNAGHMGAGAALLLLAFAGWIIALAGVSAVRSELGGVPQGGVSGLGTTGSFDWWVVWFEFAVLLMAAAVLFAGFYAAHAGVSGLLATLTALTMLEVNAYYDTWVGTGHSDKRVNTAFAGFIILSICNAFLILVMGTRADELEGTFTRNKGTSVPAGATTANTAAARPAL